MPFVLNMPKLSPTMEEGLIVKWNKKEGDFVKSSDVLLSIGTDKATIDYNVLDEGYLRKILKNENESAKINEPIAIFSENENDDISNILNQPDKTSENVEKISEKKVAKEEEVLEKLEADTKDRIIASPLAKRIAKEQNVDLSKIQGSGPHGRIMKRDLQNFDEKSFQKSFEIPSGTYEEKELSHTGKIIAKKMKDAKQNIPHFYVTQEVDVTELVEMRDELKSQNINITYNDFIIRASALALNDFSKMNTGFNQENETIMFFKTIDISFAVTVDENIMTPIIQHANLKHLGEISEEAKKLAKKARENKLLPEEFNGGSFTVSNLGMFNILSFSAIINAPQSAILAVGGILEKPVIRDGEIHFAKIMTLNLACDHRIIDGALASKFINEIKNLLENPAVLIVK